MKICFLSMLIAPKIHECLCERVILRTGLFFSSIQTRLTENHKSRMIRQVILRQIRLLAFAAFVAFAGYAYPQVSVLSFLKASFSSMDAVLTCTFLGIFCLNPHFRRMRRYMYGYDGILCHFSL